MAPLAAVRGAVGALRAQADPAQARAWEAAERESAIATLDAVIQELTVYRGRLLVAHKEDGRWGSSRDRDYVDWRARMTGSGRGTAAGELTVAEGLDAMPEVARAVDSGALSIEHAKALARLRADASEEVKQALDDGVTAELVEHAKRKKLSAPELAKEARRQAASIDAQAAQESYDATWRRRSVTFGKAAGGGRSGQWVLDDVGGTLVETALDAVVGPIAADDDRSRAQRHADALVTLASRTLQVGSDLNGAQVRPHLALVVSEDTWAAARAHQDAVDASTGSAADRVQGDGAAFGLRPDGTAASVDSVESAARSCTVLARPASVPALPDVPPAELEDGTLVPLRELQRLMCDCEVTRMVMTADSVPLDVGMTQRTYTRELRRAVTTRDRTCQWPGCTIRAAWSEIHHIVWFSRGGPTSVGNAATLCSYHHHVVHNESVRIVPLADGFGFHRADGSLIGTRRRPPGRRRGAPPGAGDRSPQAPPGAGELLDAWNAARASDGRARPQLPDALKRPSSARQAADAAAGMPGTTGGAPGKTEPEPCRGRTLWEDDADLPDQPSDPPF
ncbi:HNH endonuclease [Georgenia sp. EYE_87]|nr:HNH endonuclease [Georgenia sp. EYE_87]